mmetsp:Transcript_2325/g.4633  ORF Transcript_2325/g.4633 Transcript_2325/m.4633 type:complete len:202 (+) Transcript_2325:184-789(+)
MVEGLRGIIWPIDFLGGLLGTRRHTIEVLENVFTADAGKRLVANFEQSRCAPRGRLGRKGLVEQKFRFRRFSRRDFESFVGIMVRHSTCGHARGNARSYSLLTLGGRRRCGFHTRPCEFNDDAAIEGVNDTLGIPVRRKSSFRYLGDRAFYIVALVHCDKIWTRDKAGVKRSGRFHAKFRNKGRFVNGLSARWHSWCSRAF